MKTYSADGHTIEIGDPDKVLFPESVYTRLDVVLNLCYAYGKQGEK